MARTMQNDERTERTPDPDRLDRAMVDTREMTDDRARTDAERIAAFRRNHFQVVLPDLPKIEGWHLCWLTTTNPSDTIPARLRLGYELLKSSDYPEFQHLAAKSAGYEGCIMVNEMIAAKLPLSLYSEFMKIAHHDGPIEEDEKIVALLDRARDDALRHKGRLDEEPGMADFRKAPPRPKFEDGHHGKLYREDSK